MFSRVSLLALVLFSVCVAAQEIIVVAAALSLPAETH